MNTLTSTRPSGVKPKLMKQLVKMSVNTEENFRTQVKTFAIKNHMTVTTLVHKSLKEYMRKEGKEDIDK